MPLCSRECGVRVGEVHGWSTEIWNMPWNMRVRASNAQKRGAPLSSCSGAHSMLAAYSLIKWSATVKSGKGGLMNYSRY